MRYSQVQLYEIGVVEHTDDAVSPEPC
jgi:hypothetical protein